MTIKKLTYCIIAGLFLFTGGVATSAPDSPNNSATSKETAPAAQNGKKVVQKKNKQQPKQDQTKGDAKKQKDAGSKKASPNTGKDGDKPTGPVAVESFEKGYKAFTKENYDKACIYLYDYMRQNDRGAEDYEWAEFFLGVSLMRSGFSHGAVDTLGYLVSRKPNTKIVSYILEMFETISRTKPFDYDQLINRAVCDQEYGFVDRKTADFVHYHQGLFDWQNGFTEWAENHFKQIRKDTYYYYRYKHQMALYTLFEDDINKAIGKLEEIEKADFEGEDLKNEIRKTLARLYYEIKEYEKADETYERISKSIAHQAENLFERSWAQYRLDEQEKAMGLLYAFKSPLYKNYFTPEYFLLKSLIYKGVCHYRRALSVIDEFRDHYQTSLTNIYERGKITENQSLLLVLLGKQRVGNLWKFIVLLEKEYAMIEDLDDPHLQKFLKKIYDIQIEQTKKEFRLLVTERYEEIANDLLEYEEKANLMAYEIGLDMYQRVYQYHYDETKKKKKEKKKLSLGMKHYYAFYPFQGEFWSDELDNYKVILKDKCANMEEWDIFFK